MQEREGWLAMGRIIHPRRLVNKDAPSTDEREVELRKVLWDLQCHVTTFASKTDTDKREQLGYILALAHQIRTTSAASKEELPLIKFALFGDQRSTNGALRHNTNVVALTGIELDYDGGEISPAEVVEKLKAQGIIALVYTTPSHLHRGKGNRWRILAPLRRVIKDTPEKLKARRDRLVARVNGVFGGVIGDESFTLAQAYYYGSVNGGRRTEVFFCGEQHDRFIDQAEDLDAGAIYKAGQRTPPIWRESRPDPIPDHSRHTLAYDKAALKDECCAVAHALEGNRNNRLNHAAFKLGTLIAGSALSETDVRRDLYAAALTAGLSEAEAERTIESGMAAGMKDPRGGLRSDDSGEGRKRTGEHEVNERDGLEVVRVSDVEARPVEWIWEGRLALGKLTLLAGYPGTGKTTIACDIAAHITTRKRSFWPDNQPARRTGSVILLSGEDSVADTLRPRLEAANADLDRVQVIGMVHDGTGRRSFNLQDDLHRLRQRIQRYGDVCLLILDPITAYLGSDVDSHRVSDVRAILEPLTRLADEMRVAILAITHPPKQSTAAIHAFVGSTAFVGASRLAFLAMEEQGADRCLLLPVKSNIGPQPKGLAYKIVGHKSPAGIQTAQVEWATEPVDTTADEALAALRRPSREGRREEAVDILREELASGPVPVKELYPRLAARGVTIRMRDYAQKVLGIRPAKADFDGGWIWALPDRRND